MTTSFTARLLAAGSARIFGGSGQPPHRDPLFADGDRIVPPTPDPNIPFSLALAEFAPAAKHRRREYRACRCPAVPGESLEHLENAREESHRGGSFRGPRTC